ncbi:hypothetical protein TNCV_1611851 [Trichonephila clavipes]|nr:hypothetical protein TNCV_1611851 [Trichonephila clavipes]
MREVKCAPSGGGVVTNSKQHMGGHMDQGSHPDFCAPSKTSYGSAITHGTHAGQVWPSERDPITQTMGFHHPERNCLDSTDLMREVKPWYLVRCSSR